MSLAENFSLKIGLKKQIVIGQIFTVLTFACFLGSTKIPTILWLASLFWGLSAGFFWFGWHGLLVKDGYFQEYGQSLGVASALETLFLVISPILGGTLASKFGYQAFFGCAFGFLIFGFLTPAFLPEEKTHTDVTLKEILKLYLTHKRMLLTYASQGGMANLYSIVFILYLFLILKKEIAIGEFFSFSLVLVALSNLLTGKLVDTKGKNSLVVFGSLFCFLVWLGRFLIKNVTSLFILDVIYRISLGMLGIPLGVLSYQKALDGQSTGRAILFREIAISFGAIFTCVLLILLSLIGFELKFFFLIGSVFSLFPLLVIKRI